MLAFRAIPLEILMHSFSKLMPVFAIASLVAASTGCSDDASVSQAADPSSEDALTAAAIKVVPASDRCAAPLKDIGRGLAGATVGLSKAKSVTITLLSETDTRAYIVKVDGKEFTEGG